MVTTLRARSPFVLLIALTLAGAMAACGGNDSTAPKGQVGQIAGHWTGSSSFGGVTFSADFTQQGTSVGGSGRFDSPLGSGPFTVSSGHVDGANVTLALTSEAFGAATYTGHFDTADRISGQLHTESFSDVALTIDRQ
jgi:hypothetical protein